MNIILIPTAKLVNEELQSRYGKIVPILIPLENGIVLDRLYKEYENYDQEEITSLLEAYQDEFTTYTYVFETRDSLNNSYLVELANQKSQSEF